MPESTPMGSPRPKNLPGSSEHATIVNEGILDCAGASPPCLLYGKFNFSTFYSYGDIHFSLERSFNGAESFVEFAPNKKIELNRSYIINEPERGGYWRIRAVRLSIGGQIRYRFSQ